MMNILQRCVGRGTTGGGACSHFARREDGQPGVAAQLRIQLVVLLEGLLLVALEALLQDVDAEHALLALPLVLLLVLPAHLLPVALEVGLPLGQRGRLLLVARLDNVRAFDEAVLQSLQAPLADFESLLQVMRSRHKSAAVSL